MNSFSKPVVQDPCLPKSLPKPVTLSTNETSPTYTRMGIGDFEQCQKNLKSLLNINAPCSDDPCSFNGVYQPVINYSSLEIFGFSEYWYTTDDILQVSGDYNFNKFQDAASVKAQFFCLSRQLSLVYIIVVRRDFVLHLGLCSSVDWSLRFIRKLIKPDYGILMLFSFVSF